MQAVAKLWKSTMGKIIIISGSVVGLCVLCGIFGSLIPSTPSSDEPTADISVLQTSAVETAIAEIMLKQPTAIIAPTFTSAPVFAEVALADYPRVAASRFQTLKEAVVELAETHNQFATDPSVAQNNDWYFHTTATLTRVVTSTAELAAMNNYPAEYTAFHEETQHLADEAKLLEANYMEALDNQDMDAWNQATVNLGNVITYINQASASINVVSATSTPIPTMTPLPTVTFVYIPPPTSAPDHPAGTSGQCVDGSYTSAQHRQGACSHHGGILLWWGP